jgi:hypothetical protein
MIPSSATGSTISILPNMVADSGGDDRDIDEERAKNDVIPLSGVKEEKWWQITIQVSIPFFIAGLGTICAGIILGHVKVGLTTKHFIKNFINFRSSTGKFSKAFPSFSFSCRHCSV